MTALETVHRTLAALRAVNIPHMLTGALVSNFYGIERSTTDADIVIQLHPGGVFEEFARRLGPGLELDEQITFETITGSWRHIIIAPGIQFVVELFLLGGDAHQQEAFRRRRRLFSLERYGGEVFIPTAEDVIVQKLRWGRPKDVEDIRDVLAVQGDALDWSYLEHWCAQHGSAAKLAELRAAVMDL